jgi:hypothetical protein
VLAASVLAASVLAASVLAASVLAASVVAAVVVLEEDLLEPPHPAAARTSAQSAARITIPVGFRLMNLSFVVAVPPEPTLVARREHCIALVEARGLGATGGGGSSTDADGA